MRKTLVIVISLLIMAGFLLTGCSKTSTTPTTGTQGAADIQAIKDRGVLNVGVKVDVPKFGFKDPKTGQIDGMEIDLARAMAKKILGDETKINLQAVTAKTRGPLLDNGELDMVIATFTITDERKLSYNFSDPYFTDGVALMVKKASGIQSLKDLDGKKIGVAQSATSKKALEDAAKQAGGINLSFLEFGTYPEIKTALDSGRVDCFSVDGAILNGYLDDSVVILADRFSPQNYGIATKKSNTALAELVNTTVNEMKQSGELEKLIQKWGIK